MTDTADYADIVLPATTFLEHADMQGAYGHYYVQLSDQAIAPLGEARSNVWLFGQLGQRIGFSEACFRDTEQQMLAQALREREDATRIHKWTASRLDQLRTRAQHSPSLGRGARGALPALCRWRLRHALRQRRALLCRAGRTGTRSSCHPSSPPKNRATAPIAHTRSSFSARKADNYMNSTFANLPTHQKMEKCPHGQTRDSSRRRSIAAAFTKATRSRSSMIAAAFAWSRRSTPVLPAGVVASRLNWNKLSAGGSNVNALTSERLTDIGRGPTFYSTLVEVARISHIG